MDSKYPVSSGNGPAGDDLEQAKPLGLPAARTKFHPKGRPKRKSSEAQAEAETRTAKLAALRSSAQSDVVRYMMELAWVREHFSTDVLDLEPDLLSRRWPGYGHLSCLEATEEFAASYDRIYRQSLDESGKDAEASRPLADSFSMNSPEDMTALWKARQIADAAGLPYEAYLRRIIRLKMRLKPKHPPRPNQLYAKAHAAVVGRLINLPITYHENMDAFQRLASNQRYHARNYQGLEDQDAVISRIQECIDESSDKPATIAKFVFDLRLLSIAKVREIYNADLVDEAIRRGPVTTEEVTAPDKLRYQPTCFGLIDITDRAYNCSHCTFSGMCFHTGQKATKYLNFTGLDADPKRARERKLSAARQRKRREKSPLAKLLIRAEFDRLRRRREGIDQWLQDKEDEAERKAAEDPEA